MFCCGHVRLGRIWNIFILVLSFGGRLWFCVGDFVTHFSDIVSFLLFTLPPNALHLSLPAFESVRCFESVLFESCLCLAAFGIWMKTQRNSIHCIPAFKQNWNVRTERRIKEFGDRQKGYHAVKNHFRFHAVLCAFMFQWLAFLSRPRSCMSVWLCSILRGEPGRLVLHLICIRFLWSPINKSSCFCSWSVGSFQDVSRTFILSIHLLIHLWAMTLISVLWVFVYMFASLFLVLGYVTFNIRALMMF